MQYKEFIDAAKQEFEKALVFFEQETQKLRTSRTSPALVEDLQVDCFGSVFALKQLAAIACPQPNQIVITPWDASYVEPIERSVAKSGLGMSSAVDKNVIRLSLPLLTQEYREQMAKILNERAERCRQTMRRTREDAWNKVQAAQKAKQLTEDDKFRAKDALQDLVDEYQKNIETLVERKKQEIA
ncbi:MAG: ribosome-recycling factor [Candidatus Saccharimonadales bacterium]